MFTTQTETYATELTQTIGSIFETMLGMEVVPLPRPLLPVTNRLAASVHFSGSWSGVVILDVSFGQACLFAGRFLGIDVPEEVDNDVRDVIGELANMIGGNLKSAVAPDAALSLPEVVDGGRFHLRICGPTSGHTQSFESEGGLFSVTLIQAAANSYVGATSS